MEEEAFFYFSPGGKDVTSWTQRKFSRTYWTGLLDSDEMAESDSSDTNWTPQQLPTWRQPVWRRADARFFWNSHILAEAIHDADRILRAQGFPDYSMKPDPGIKPELFESQIIDLEGLIMPIIQGYVEMEKLSLFPTTTNVNAFPKKQQSPLCDTNQTPVSTTIHPDEQRGVAVYYSPSSQNTNVNDDYGTVVFQGLNKSSSMRTNHVPSTNVSGSADSGHSSLRNGSPQPFASSNSTINETVQSTATKTPTNTSNRETPKTSLGDITVILISRRSRFRAG